MTEALPTHCLLIAACLAACDGPAKPPAGREGGVGGADGAGKDARSVAATDAVPSVERIDLVSPLDGANGVALRAPLCWVSRDSAEGSIRYRVFIDGIELKSGRVGRDGFEGPCTDELAFDEGRTFRWRVEAYEPSEEARVVAASETRTFSTLSSSDGVVVFSDDFEIDKGWQVTGDAATGAWVRGRPEETLDGEKLSQPGICEGGNGCYFTGHNRSGDPSDQDVDGGIVVLTSPSFDLSGAASIAVSLSRFFYRSDKKQTGSRMQIELVLPDPDEADGLRAFVLEEIDLETAEGRNAWAPVAFAVCDAPFGPDARLRITAADSGTEVVEAAVDSVAVIAHSKLDICSRGPGALCDPTVSESCEAGLHCCQQGTLSRGIHRCVEPARAIDPSDPAPKGEPYAGVLGCPLPDLTVVADVDSVAIETEDFSEDACALREQCIGASGARKILRFGMRTRNEGATDLVLGVPANRPDQYHYDRCHEHYHFEGFAHYSLIDPKGTVVATGDKIAQCVWDSVSFAWPGAGEGEFSCYSQGLSVGYEDDYDASLPCQWLDITDVAPGDYTLKIEVNTATAAFASPRLVERDYENNSTSFAVTIPAE